MTTRVYNRSIACHQARRSHRLHDLVALWRQRQALRRLDDAALDDLGLSRRAVMREARRPFWDVPGHLRG